MKLKKSKATLSLLLTAALLSPIAANFPFAVSQDGADAQSVALDYIDYNADEIDVTEDYSAVVGSATATTANGGYWASNRSVVRLGNMTRQLDDGKSGLLVTSKKTGDGADGSGFSFSNRLYDDFSMDFRVFSSETYYGFFAANAGDPSDDRFNPFLDLKEVGITLTSVSDPSVSFTVDVRGAASWNTATVNASVYVSGESYETGAYRGYGVMDSGAVRANYATNLKGTSFCNVSTSQTNESTKIEVDMQTMRVYGVSYETAFVAGAPVVTEKKMLIRDLVTNKNDAGTLVAEGLGVVSPEGFKDGYTVSVTFNDVTSNETELEYTKYNGTGDGFFTSVDTLPVNENEATVYERNAKMIVYSVNGQSLKKTAGFTAAQATFMEETYTWSDGKTPVKGSLQLSSNETGLGAEGASVSYDGVKTGAFEQEFIVYSNINNPVHINNMTTAHLYGGGNGYNADDAFPQADVKEIGFEFTSNSDPTKTFTLYIRATSGTWAQAYIPSARVAVAGDRVRTVDFESGYGLNTGKYRDGTVFIEKAEEIGKFNPTTGSKLDGGFGNFYGTQGNGKVKIKFDPVEMKVYGEANGEYALIRDLAENSGFGVPLEYVAALSAADFADGYTVKFSVCDVTRDGFIGIENADRMVNKAGTVTGLGGNTPQITAAQAAARTAKIIFCGVEASDFVFSQAAEAEYNKKLPTVKLGELVKDVACNLKPTFGGVMATEVKLSGNILYQNGGESGEIAANDDGEYLFMPTKYGEYRLRLPVDWSGETATLEVSVRVKDIVAPTVALKDGLAGSHVLSSNGVKPQISDNDVAFSDDSGACDLEITVTRDKKSVALENAFEEAGVYEITYTVRDEFDNISIVSRKFTVYALDKEEPVIGVLGGDTTVSVGDVVAVPECSAFDNYDGELTASVKVYFGNEEIALENGAFTAEKVGKYVVYYTATDGEGNQARETVTITVKAAASGCAARIGGAQYLAATVFAGLVAAAVMKRKKVK